MSLTLIYTFNKSKGSGGSNTLNNDGDSQMGDLLIFKEMSNLVIGLCDYLVCPFCLYACDNKLFGCDVCFISVIARIGTITFPNARPRISLNSH